MSTTHGQPGLSSDQRSTIRSTILRTRDTLEDELRRQLEKYGIYEDRRLPVEDLSHLSAEERHTRRTLDAAIERELESTEGDLERSITNYVREATKTYLNRFVALKTIEVRDLVEETITERPEYSNRSYMHHTVAEIAGGLTNAPDDGFGAALDLAYQEIGAEIRMVFDESEHTAIDLDAQVRKEVPDELDAIDDDAWESDEALGWVYQYFGEEEREEIDERVDEENYKIAGTDIATKTQLFTPRYIVEWMVDNSLGRTWLEMQGERTNIDDKENCFYLAPLEDSLIGRGTKAVEDITVLDPACGSGHMLFYAFDVLYQMYLEEGEIPEEYIPREILRNNLYGIDIDSGAAQIAALSLYLKAKERSPSIEIPQLNIVSSDTVLINGPRKTEILNRADSELEEDILEQIWKSFDNIRERGSLVKVEKKIDELLEEHRDAFEAKGQTQFTSEGDLSSQSTFIAGGEEVSWDTLKSRLMGHIQDLAEAALQQDDPIEEMFADEVGKTVELLDVLISSHDVVISNPPYLASGKMGKDLKSFVKNNYIGYLDLYTAFIERCTKFAIEDGYVSMVTPENYMFLKSYEDIRQKIMSEHQWLEGMHLSRYGFQQAKDSFTIPFLIRNSDPGKENISRFYRMTHEQEKYAEYKDKIEGLEEITKYNRELTPHEDVYVIDQTNFLDIERVPFIYWMGEEILNLFSAHGKLGEISESGRGLQTGDNQKFTRKYWEVSEDLIGNKYELFQKSGSDSPYFDLPDDVVLWGPDGEYLKDQGEPTDSYSEFYFEETITFRRFGKVFTARMKDENTIFDINSPFVYSDQFSNSLLLGILNSTLTRYIMNGINPGMNFQPGDASQIPIKVEYSNSKDIIDYAEKAITQRKRLASINETCAVFDPHEFENKLVSIRDAAHFLKVVEADIKHLQSYIDDLIFDDYQISDETINSIYEDIPRYPETHQLYLVEGGESDEIVSTSIFSPKLLSEKKENQAVEFIEGNIDESDSSIANELEISSLTISLLRYKYDLYSENSLAEFAARTLSYYIGVLLGRWETRKGLDSSSQEILVFDPKSDDGISNNIFECIRYNMENPQEIKGEFDKILGGDSANWLRNKFFSDHHTDEYSRRGEINPIYWQLESPSGAFSCFLYYHEIDANTLPKLRGQYLDPQINELENELETLNAQTSGDNPDKDLLSRKEQVQNNIDDIKQFRDTIDGMIDNGVTVDVEKGIWENIKEWDQYEVLETGLPKLKSSYSR